MENSCISTASGDLLRLSAWSVAAQRNPALLNSSILEHEPDALREGQRGAVINGIGRSAHVALPSIRARFAAAARLFLSTERTADLGARRAEIDIGDAAVGADA